MKAPLSNCAAGIGAFPLSRPWHEHRSSSNGVRLRTIVPEAATLLFSGGFPRSAEIQLFMIMSTSEPGVIDVRGVSPFPSRGMCNKIAHPETTLEHNFFKNSQR